MMAASVTLKGRRELEKVLRHFKPSVVRKIMRPGVAAASAPIRKAMRQNAPKESGLLKKSIKTKVKTSRAGNITAVTGVDKKVVGTHDGKKRWPIKYAHLVEFGTKTAAANPFMRRAWEQHKGGSTRVFLDRAWIAVETEAKRAAKR